MAGPFYILGVYFVYLLLILFASYAIGYFILSLFKYKPSGVYAALFNRGLAGLATSVFLFSIFTSSAITVQWGIPLVVFFIFFELHKAGRKRTVKPIMQITPAKRGDWFKYIPGLILTLLVFGWFAYHNINFNNSFPYAIPHKDEIYYTNISTALIEWGYENRQGAYIHTSLVPATEPYHYFDLWFTAMVSFFTGTPTILSVSLICLPFFSVLTIFGILSVFETTGPLRSWHYGVAPLLLFTRGAYLVLNNPDILWAQNFSETLLEFKSEKLGVIYVIALLAFRFILSGNIMAGIAAFLILPIVSIGNLPGLAGGLLLFIVLALFVRRITIREFLRSFLYISLVGIFIWLFYRLTSGQEGNAYLKNGVLVFTDLSEFSFQSVKVTGIELLVRILHNPWRTLVIHLPFLILAFIAVRENRQYAKAAVLMMCVYTASLLAFGFFYKLLDAPQFYTNNLPILNVFLLIGVIIFINSGALNRLIRKIIFLGAVSLLVVILVFSLFAYSDSLMFTELYSQKYLQEVSLLHSKLTEKKEVAVFYNPEQEPDLYNCDKSGPNVMYLPFLPKFKPPVDINVFAMEGWSRDKEIAVIQKRFMRNSPFYRFVMEQVAAGKFTDIPTAQLDYLRQKHIQYLFVSPGIRLNHELVSLVKKRIKDERSGEQLLVLNPFPDPGPNPPFSGK